MDNAEIISQLKKNHPYPTDVFIEPTKEQWERFHKVLKKVGIESGGFIGHACRIGYDACIYMFETTN